MYTWGYLKDSILSKLDLEEEEAENMNYLKRFIFYANEAMTQICSSVMPKRTYFEVEIYANEYDSNGILIREGNVNTLITMPSDFISFGDDVNFILYTDDFGNEIRREAFSNDFSYYGYNQIMFNYVGKYSISYNARWLLFGIKNYDYDEVGQDNDTVLNAPIDVLDCIPSYVASQCLKIDDESKSLVFRNEYELLLARIDNTDFKSNKTFTIGGDW